MEQINHLIVMLNVIDSFSYDMHYTVHGDAFYSKHIFVEKFNFREDIDLLKEAVLLGHGWRPLSNKMYLAEVSTTLHTIKEDNDKENFEVLFNFISDTIDTINVIEINDRAVNAILDNIAIKLRQYIGLLNLQMLKNVNTHEGV